MKVTMNERDIFLNALEKSDEQARAKYLDEACESDSELRARIEDLLAANSKASKFLEHSPPGLALTIQTDPSRATSHSLPSSSLDFLTPSKKPGCMGTLGVYEVVGVVGRGAFGIVLRAYDTKLNRIVAIKVMSPELSTNPIAVARFLREAQAAAAVRHDHVVTIHAIEETHEPPFIVMDFVEGESLQEKIDREGSLQLHEILRIGKQIAAGLVAAHSEGLVHRDIKPANILLENGIQRVQITDFGLARAVDDVGMTQTGIIAGTPQFMSPEQGLGKPIDARSDLFSLGSVLYALCTGRAPFRADSAVATLRRVCDDPPRSIREMNPEIPEWLERIVLQLLSKDAAERIQSAKEIEDVLGACLSHIQSNEDNPPPAASRALSHAYKSKESQVSQRLSSHSVRLLWMLMGHLAAVLCTCVAFVIEMRSIMYLAPLLSLAAIPVAVLAFRKRLGWFHVGYGIYWPLMLISFYCAYAASMAERLLVEVVLPCAAVVGILWGVTLLAKHFFDLIRQPVFKLSILLPSDNLYVGLAFVQCLGLALAAANSMIEPEAAVPWAAILLSTGTLVSSVCIATARDKLSLAFAVSTVVLSATVLVMGSMFPLDDYLFDARANWPVRVSLMIIFSVVLLGLSNLHRELVRTCKINGLTKRFNTKSGLVVVALLAAVLAAARPFLEFSGQAFFAGFLMFLTVVSLAYLLTLAIGGMRLRRKLSITIWLVCIATLVGVSRLTYVYDLHTRSTHLWVETKEEVDLRIIQSNAHFPRNLTARPGDAGWSFHSGAFEIEVVGRDDLKAVPSKLDPPPRVWTKVEIVPIDPAD